MYEKITRSFENSPPPGMLGFTNFVISQIDNNAKMCQNSDIIHQFKWMKMFKFKHSLLFIQAKGAMHIAHSHNIHLAAFTLAEVLITLGIIGVVAAMTIPALMTKYQHKVRETEFKKAYSALQQALYSIDPDMISAWTSNAGDTDAEFYTELYSKYRVITDEDNTQILSYMEENGIPMVSRAFIETRNQFLNNGLSNEKPKVKRFIPKTKYTIVN